MMQITKRMAAAILAVALVEPSVAGAEQPKTFFDYVQSSWAVGTISLSRELKFREGRLRATPGRFDELLRAKLGKPRSIMFVYELQPGETDVPYDTESPMFAPIELLPRYKFWRDNLPQTPHHSAPSGRRYIFTGEALGPASTAAKAWTKTLSMKGKDRWRAQNAILAGAMLSDVEVLREDGVRHLARQLPLTRELDSETVSKLERFVTGEYPRRERERVVRAIGRAKAKSMAGALEKLAGRDDETAAVALGALAAMDRPRSREQLDALLDAQSPAVRAWAIEVLAASASSDEDALQVATDVLSGDDAELVRGAAARGLGEAGAEAAVEPLAKALARDDEASQDAGAALARIGSAPAIAALKSAARGRGSSTMIAAVLGLGAVANCADCTEYLRELRTEHEDPAVRDIIGVILDSGQDASG